MEAVVRFDDGGHLALTERVDGFVNGLGRVRLGQLTRGKTTELSAARSCQVVLTHVGGNLSKGRAPAIFLRAASMVFLAAFFASSWSSAARSTRTKMCRAFRQPV